MKKIPDLRSRKTVSSRSGNPAVPRWPVITVTCVAGGSIAGIVVMDRCVGNRFTCVEAPATPVAAIAPVAASAATAATDAARVSRDARMTLLRFGLNPRQATTPRERLGPAVRYSAATGDPTPVQCRVRRQLPRG